MNKRLEQISQLQKICLNEFQQAQLNSECYSSNMRILADKLKANWQDSSYFLTQYDSFIMNITAIMEVTRKFNLQMCLHNMKLLEMQSIFPKIDEKDKFQNGCDNTNLLKDSFTNLFPAEEYDVNLETDEQFVYPSLNLKEIYKENTVISGRVTYISSLKDFNFYIFDKCSEYLDTIVQLSKSLELRQYNGMPATNEVFGFVLDNYIFRAVLGCKKFYDVEMHEEIFPCYLLDTGETVPLKFDSIMYRLSDVQKCIPAQAVLCKLNITTKNPFLLQDIENKLKDIENENCCDLKVLAIEGNTLLVELIDKPQETVMENKLENLCLESVSIDQDLIKTNKKQLTEEELEMLYEEPLCTSNAMKAVMGYDPQDDKRICRFYNPKTGGCFKGANCKLEHTLRQPDGWTKDVLPAASIIDCQHPTRVYTAGSIINITPTYIGRLDRFYAQINDPHQNNTPLIWNDEDIPSWKHLKKPPHMYELVLSRYNDGLWYRAKIMSHDDDYKMFKVFYVDYGNCQMVHLKNLASIDISTAQLPFQAVLCRIDTVCEQPSLLAEDRKIALEQMCEIILNKSLDVKVVSHYEDLFISFLDNSEHHFPHIFLEMGFLKLN